MKNYTVHFIDRKNFVFALEELLSFNDAEAIMEVRERLLPPYCAGFESGAVRPQWGGADVLEGCEAVAA